MLSKIRSPIQKIHLAITKIFLQKKKHYKNYGLAFDSFLFFAKIAWFSLDLFLRLMYCQDKQQAPVHSLTIVSRSKESKVSLELDRVRSSSSSMCFCLLRTFQCKHSANESNQSVIWSCEHILGTG